MTVQTQNPTQYHKTQNVERVMNLGNYACSLQFTLWWNWWIEKLGRNFLKILRVEHHLTVYA